MDIIRGNGSAPAGTAIALGYFDGVHLGHQAVIGAACEAAGRLGLVPAVFTFTFEGGAGHKGRSLMAEGSKHAALAGLGVQLCFEPPFAKFNELTPQAFFEELLVGRYHAKAVFCGDNFRFGKGAAGDVALLREMCGSADIALNVVPTTLWQGAPVSSSRIRAALSEGDIPAVNAMLGRPYEISFPVQAGRHLGTQLGFPTINQVYPKGMQQPACGVYITGAMLGGKVWPAATGYGTRPTVAGKEPTCETFIPGFSGDLYGTRVRVRFYQRIDDTQTFASPEALAEAVQGWAAQAKAYFAVEH